MMKEIEYLAMRVPFPRESLPAGPTAGAVVGGVNAHNLSIILTPAKVDLQADTPAAR